MMDAWIIDAVRTPRGRGKPDGSLARVHPQDLAATCMNALVSRNSIDPGIVEDVILGCGMQVKEQGRDIARAAVFAAGWPVTAAGVSLNRFCGSGLTAVNLAAALVAAGGAEIVVAGGVESMSRVPLGSDTGPLSEKITARFPDLTEQGLAADRIARKEGFRREDLDAFACGSQQKTARAAQEGRFKKSLVPVNVPSGGEGQPSVTVTADEHPRPATTQEGLAKLKPAFAQDGLHTAGTSSGIVDGAAAVLIASPARARALGLTPRARIAATATVGDDPVAMLLGPIQATRACLARWGKPLAQVDLIECNEAFAVVPMVTGRALDWDPAKLNVNGGAIALGHPLGATGAILLGTILDELERTNRRVGLITLCTRYGMGVTTILERA